MSKELTNEEYGDMLDELIASGQGAKVLKHFYDIDLDQEEQIGAFGTYSGYPKPFKVPDRPPKTEIFWNRGK